MSLRVVIPALWIVSSFVGCAPHVHRHHSSSARPSAEMLPLVDRVARDGRRRCRGVNGCKQREPTRRPAIRHITAAECQCLACDASVIGSLLDRERWTSCLHDLKASDRRARCLQLGVLRAAANEARDRIPPTRCDCTTVLRKRRPVSTSSPLQLTVIDDVDGKLATSTRTHNDSLRRLGLGSPTV